MLYQSHSIHINNYFHISNNIEVYHHFLSTIFLFNATGRLTVFRPLTATSLRKLEHRRPTVYDFDTTTRADETFYSPITRARHWPACREVITH